MAAAPLLPILLLGGAALVLAAKAKAGSDAGSRPKPKPMPSYTLDPNLPPQLRDQVLAALATEQDGAKLEQFAAAIENQYPLAAASLRLKASLFKSYIPGVFGRTSMPQAPIMRPPSTPNVPQTPVIGQQVPMQVPTPQAPAMPPSAPPSTPPFIPPATTIQTPMGQIQTPAIPSMSIPTPAISTASLPIPSVLGGLDPGMPLDMQKAVAGALTTESDPAKLEGFASAIQGQYPVAAGLLIAKANALRLAQVKTPASPIPEPGIVVSTQSMGGTYKVLEGDYAIKIAKKFTGEENRWKELIKANPKKKKAKDGNFASLYPGEILNLPPDWPSTPSGGN